MTSVHVLIGVAVVSKGLSKEPLREEHL